MFAAQLTVLSLSRTSSPRPTQSAVARQALLDYAAKVAAMNDEERRIEARRVSSASKALRPDLDEVDNIKVRLEAAAASSDAPLPTLAQVTFSPPMDVVALELSVNRMLKAAHPRKFADLPTE